MKKIGSRKRNKFKAVALCILMAFATASEAATLNLADTPLYLSTTVDPNILLTFDDSGSMAWAFLPDSVGNDYYYHRFCSSAYNRVYYDPSVTYKPPVNADGTPLNATPTSFTAAYVDGFHPSVGTLDLSQNYQPSWDDYYIASCGLSWNPGPAYYYSFSTACGNLTSDACYTLVQYLPGVWTPQEQQNFANWYSYYRRRTLLAKTSAGLAFSRLPTSVRVTAQHLNNTDPGSGTNIMFTNAIGLMQPFSGTARTDFFTRLYNAPASGGTPLRLAAQQAGDYFGAGNTGANSPYRDVPGNASSPERSCRQNFQVIFTDGYWNGAAGVSGNIDGTSQTLGDKITTYATQPPYTDTTADTLADNTFNYWFQDLRPDLTNNVPAHFIDKTGTTSAQYWNPVNDPATWQHLVTFTIGLGIDGTLPNTQATYDGLVNGTIKWPAAAADSQTAVDDLWHAAIDSRAKYFSASNPTDLINAFTGAITSVTERISSASAVAMNSGSLSTNNFLYQARFNSADWTGQLLAYAISSAGDVATDFTWNAGQKLNLQDFDTGRTILSYNDATNSAVRFRWADLSPTQQTALDYNPVTFAQDTQGADRLNYLRGSAANEGAGNNYRVRARICSYSGGSPVACPSGTNTGTLGDTIDSAPVFVGPPPFGYPDNLETAPYSAFSKAHANRPAMIYVGANDGMLHGFDATTGAERITYVPSKVYQNLSSLTGTNYTHRFFVDGSPTMGDVFFGGAWHTILVGGLRKGGQGIYALDITDPTKFSETNPAGTVLWEFRDTDDPDLGYTYSDITIAKMANGKWAAIFGNGYNSTEPDGAASTTGNPYLYILFIDGGLDGKWSANDFVKLPVASSNTAAPNGLATPAVVDVNGDNVADYIYAGDLQGNLWKWNVTNPDPTTWAQSSPGKPAATLVFTAKDASNKTQPITSAPQIGQQPAGLPGYMVYFGTGKYLEAGVNGDASTVGATMQTFYGIWDSALTGTPAPARSNLLQQTVINTQTVNGYAYRVVSNNPITWSNGKTSPGSPPGYMGWYLDLPDTGEKQVTDSMLRNGAIIFTTLIPSSDPCASGGSGWLMELNAENGGWLPKSPFDVNGDSVIDSQDLLTLPSGGGSAPPGGRLISDGIPSVPAILVGGNPASSGSGSKGCQKEECKYLGSTNGNITKVVEHTGDNHVRGSWREIK